jgi:peptidoglycan hydrolase-like amidase
MIAQVLPSPHRPPTLRFVVFSLFQPQRLRLQSDEPLLLFFDEELPVLLQPASILSIQFTTRGSITLQWQGRSITVARLRATATSGEFAIFSLAVPPPALHGTITRSFSGTLDVRAAHRFLQPVVMMQREDALACIVHAESAPDAPAAYFAAQTIVSRSFLYTAHTRHTGFDFCDTTHCQFLSGAPSPASAVRLALQQTQELCLVANGKPLAAMYSRSCSGRTHPRRTRTASGRLSVLLSCM